MIKEMIKIEIRTLITPEAFEKLEDKIRDLLEEEKLSGTIYNEITGNTIQTRR